MHDCCTRSDPAAPSPSPPVRERHKWPRRIGALVKWAIPTILLALMPKCPMCVAGYIALWTGLGISLTGAYYLRLALITLCILSLCFLVAMRVRRHFLRPAHT